MAQAESGELRTEPARLDLFPPLLLITGGTRPQRASNIVRSMALLQTPEELCRREVQMKPTERGSSRTPCHGPEIWKERAASVQSNCALRFVRIYLMPRLTGGVKMTSYPLALSGFQERRLDPFRH